MMPIKRRILAAAALCLAAVPPARAQTAKFDNVTITIATFGGPWIDRIQKELTSTMSAAGITMKFIGGTSEDFLAKLIAARGQPAPFDAVEIADETYPSYRGGDFLARLNAADIPNIAALDHAMYDDYKVANWASQPAIVYNIDKLKEAGIAPPRTYSDLGIPALRGRVMYSDVNTYGGYYWLLGLAYEHGGSERNPEPGFKVMATLKPQSYTSSVANQMQLFSAGDVWAAAITAHIAIRMHSAGLNVAVVHPVVDGHPVSMAYGYIGAVKGTQNQAAVEYYINQMISKHMQERLYTEAATIPVNEAALKAVQDNVATDSTGKPFLVMDQKEIDNAWTPKFDEINKRAWVRSWQSAVSSQ